MHRLKTVSSVMAVFTLLALLIAGCSAGGGGGSASNGQKESAATTNGPGLGQVAVTVTRAAAPKTARDVPAATVTIRITVLGTNIVQTAVFPPGATQIQMVVDNVPLGPQSILVEALDANNRVIASSVLAVDVNVNTTVASTVDLTPTASPSPSSSVAPSPSPSISASPTTSPSPSAPPGDTLRFSTQPPLKVASGFVINRPIVVEAVNPSGNLDTTFAAPITLSLAPNAAGATLSAASLTATPLHGVATFTGLTVTRPTTPLTLIATAAPISATSTPFTAVAPNLVFAAQPASQQQVGSTFAAQAFSSVIVEVQDPADNSVITSAGGSVALTVQPSPSPSPASLSGAVEPLNAGVASFSALSINLVGTAYNLTAAAGSAAATSSSFDVGPAVIASDIYVGATGGVNGNTLSHYDIHFRLLAQKVTLNYVPAASVVVTNVNGTWLFVAGKNKTLHVYNQALVEQVNSPYTLDDTPQQMAQDPVNHTLYITESSGVGTDGTYIYDLTGFAGGSPMLLPTTSITGLNKASGIAVDPSAAPGFWCPFYFSGLGFVSRYDIPGNGLAGSQGNGQASTVGHIDLMPAGALSAGIVSYTPGTTTLGGFSAAPIDPLSSASFGGGFNAGDFRVDVRFYDASATSATALVANDASGQIEIAVVTPHQSPVPTAVSVNQAVADPNGFVGASGAEYITLLKALPNVSALAVVTDPSKNRLMLVDLTNPTPTLYGVVPLGTGVTATCITNFQSGIPSTH